MTGAVKELKFAVISDIHLGHRNTPTEHIVKNLNKYLTNSKVLEEVDMLVMAGDVFDDLVTLGSDCSPWIMRWITHTLILCAKHDVVLRVLYGTPSHDRGQSKHFVSQAEKIKDMIGHDLDLQYVDALSIEWIERFGINVLYVPDELHHDNADTLVDVKDLMAAKGLEQVDFAFMHGIFAYQAPMIAKETIKHNEKEYLQLVKGVIFSGHDHSHSRFDRIYSQGSFDRLVHGEEEKKGFLKAYYRSPEDYEVKFIENKGAKRYVTVVSYGDDLEEELNRIDRQVCNLPDGSFVRIETKKSLPIAQAVGMLKSRWSNLTWSPPLFKEDKEKDTVKDVLDAPPEYTSIIINPTTIAKLCSDQLKAAGVDSQTYGLAMEKLMEIR